MRDVVLRLVDRKRPEVRRVGAEPIEGLFRRGRVSGVRLPIRLHQCHPHVTRRVVHEVAQPVRRRLAQQFPAGIPPLDPGQRPRPREPAVRGGIGGGLDRRRGLGLRFRRRRFSSAAECRNDRNRREQNEQWHPRLPHHALPAFPAPSVYDRTLPDAMEGTHMQVGFHASECGESI